MSVIELAQLLTGALDEKFNVSSKYKVMKKKFYQKGPSANIANVTEKKINGIK